MKKILFLLSLILAVTGCVPAELEEVTPVSSPSRTFMPSYTFSTTKAGTILYGGDCTSATTKASVGLNTVMFNTLFNGTYSNCTINVRDAQGNTSNPLVIKGFEVHAFPLNDTGQTNCSDYPFTDTTVGYEVTGSGNQNNDLNCTDLGVTQSVDGVDANGDIVRRGQDAVYGRDVTDNDSTDGHAGFSFTKLDANGVPLADQSLDYATSPWSCVRDNVTGLIWEVKTDDGGVQDKDNTYTWYNSTGVNDGGHAGTADGGACVGGSGCDTEKYVNDINALNSGNGICGINEWRLPYPRELSGIADLSAFSPAIDTNYFPNTISTSYWAVGTRTNNISYAWNTVFTSGLTSSLPKTNPRGVRLVSGDVPATGAGCTSGRNADTEIGKPDSLYVDHGDGTLTDIHTGLMWQKCTMGQSGSDCLVGTADTMTWQEALAKADEDSSAGYDDWRLPSRNELASLAEVACYAPAINQNLFPGTKQSVYWSSTPVEPFNKYIYGVNFLYGDDVIPEKDKAHYVRLVRSGT